VVLLPPPIGKLPELKPAWISKDWSGRSRAASWRAHGEMVEAAAALAGLLAWYYRGARRPPTTDCGASPASAVAASGGQDGGVPPVNVLSLFSGIGGLELGLERAGMTVVGQVEIDEFCRRVLAKHWPEVPRHDDVRTCVEWWRGESRPPVRVVAGGPPCQPSSRAGRRLGDADPRWGWPWLFDVVRAVEPQLVIVENPPAILDVLDGDAFGWILGELATLGFDADWSVLSACAMGAPHTRERLFLVAHADGRNGSPRLGAGQETPLPPLDLRSGAWADRGDGFVEAASRGRRVVDGLPDELEPARVKALGNAVVPQVAEHVGRLVMAAAA
jgi:DNA (cytosine-5)-methyltransferase 1